MKYPRIAFLFVLCGLITPAFGQEILTATAYFDTVAARYAKINDYIANITYTAKGDTMKGTLYYRSPDMIRIDFSEPKDQVLCSDGKILKVYLPKYNVLLQQPLSGRSNGQMANLATKEGLAIMGKNYSKAYLVSPDPVPLEDGSSEMVIKLKLDWRNTSQGFRQLNVSIGKDGFIRRIVGVDVGYEQYQIDFTNVKTNQNIPATRFNYDGPATANIIDDFLFGRQN
ncbi:LolA family protein [Salinispira pacifica]